MLSKNVINLIADIGFGFFLFLLGSIYTWAFIECSAPSVECRIMIIFCFTFFVVDCFIVFSDIRQLIKDRKASD